MEEKAKTKPNVGNYYYLGVSIKLFILKPGSATVIKEELKVKSPKSSYLAGVSWLIRLWLVNKGTGT